MHSYEVKRDQLVAGFKSKLKQERKALIDSLNGKPEKERQTVIQKFDHQTKIRQKRFERELAKQDKVFYGSSENINKYGPTPWDAGSHIKPADPSTYSKDPELKSLADELKIGQQKIEQASSPTPPSK